MAEAAFPPVGDHAYVYGSVPPVAVTVAEPSACEHCACVEDVVRVMAEGSVIVTAQVSEHPFESATTTE